MNGNEHKIRRKTRVYKDEIYQLDKGDLEYESAIINHVENLTKRRCTCGEVFHSDAKAIDHLRSVDTDTGSDV